MDLSLGELDGLMERASVALAAMDYLACEALCVEALSRCRAMGDWSYYARVLLPLQESRRQRRMIAAEGTIRLGTTGLGADVGRWVTEMDRGCVVVTRPHDAAVASGLLRIARDRKLYVEVLYADNESGTPRWTLCSFAGVPVRVSVDAPGKEWVDRWLRPDGGRGTPMEATGGGRGGAVGAREVQGNLPGGPGGSGGAGDWFLDACEVLGNAALGTVKAKVGQIQRVDELERCIEAAGDHEILHQRLAESARAIL